MYGLRAGSPNISAFAYRRPDLSSTGVL